MNIIETETNPLIVQNKLVSSVEGRDRVKGVGIKRHKILIILKRIKKL